MWSVGCFNREDCILDICYFWNKYDASDTLHDFIMVCSVQIIPSAVDYWGSTQTEPKQKESPELFN